MYDAVGYYGILSLQVNLTVSLHTLHVSISLNLNLVKFKLFCTLVNSSILKVFSFLDASATSLQVEF